MYKTDLDSVFPKSTDALKTFFVYFDVFSFELKAPPKINHLSVHVYFYRMIDGRKCDSYLFSSNVTHFCRALGIQYGNEKRHYGGWSSTNAGYWETLLEWLRELDFNRMLFTRYLSIPTQNLPAHKISNTTIYILFISLYKYSTIEAFWAKYYRLFCG